MLPGLILDAYSVRNPHTIPLFFLHFRNPENLNLHAV